MSSSLSPDQPGSLTQESAGASIRLPSISFLAREHAAPFESLVKPTWALLSALDSHNLSAPPELSASDQKEDIRSLPKPKALALFPLQSDNGQRGGSAPASLPVVKSESGSSIITSETSRKESNTPILPSQDISGEDFRFQDAATKDSTKRDSDGRNEILKRALATVTEETSYPKSSPKKHRLLPILEKKPLDQLLKSLYPVRKHLGSIVYNPTTTWSTLQFEQLNGLQEHDLQRLRDIRESYIARASETFAVERKEYIPVIPPLPEACINSLLEMKIQYRFIKGFIDDFTAGIVQHKREIWGGAGGIYTDDSDLLTVLCHLGLFDCTLDLTSINPDWEPTDVVRPLKVQKDSDDIDMLDLSVTLIMYPSLNAYHGFCKNGINSRSWVHGLLHDGLSYGVFQVKWETCSMSMDERSIYKKSAVEIEEDRLYEAGVVSARGGWKFDHKLYHRLRKGAIN